MRRTGQLGTGGALPGLPRAPVPVLGSRDDLCRAARRLPRTEPVPLRSDQRLDGSDPAVAATVLADLAGMEVGVWEHTAGASRDVEADEVFVVLSGRATVVVDGGPTLTLSPGDVGILQAGARTSWTVHETLRKVYVTPVGE